MKQIILGSQSPRRREILSYFSIPFEEHSPTFDEEAVPFRGNPSDYVRELSQGKAASLQREHPNAIILTADTVVYRKGKIYNKPRSEQEAFEALSELVGDWHSVYTGVTLSTNAAQFNGFEETKVLFNALTTDEIRNYHKRIHWADKAGGYAIQMAGGLIVKKIDGCYYNVMGLPINTVHSLLKKVGIELWDYVK